MRDLQATDLDQPLPKQDEEPMNKLYYQKALENLLEAIDAAPVDAGHPIFKKPQDKEFYETQLMFSFRKHQAAEYHKDTVKAMLELAEKTANAAMDDSGEPSQEIGPSIKASIVMKKQPSAYIHELSAFLAAIRSGLDFLAVAAARTMPGTSAHSVHTLEKMVNKGQQGAVLEVVKTHQKWLKQLRDYRDELVHRQVIEAPTSGWATSTKGKKSKAIMPIVVPRKTPKPSFDTRRSRMMNSDLPSGIDRTETHGEITFSDGSKEAFEHSIGFRPSASHIPIEELMTQHLTKYQRFSADMFTAISMSSFGTEK